MTPPEIEPTVGESRRANTFGAVLSILFLAALVVINTTDLDWWAAGAVVGVALGMLLVLVALSARERGWSFVKAFSEANRRVFRSQ